MLYENIKKLVEYGIQTGLTPECEKIYTTNLLLELFQEDSYEDVEIDSSSIELEAVLEGLLDEAVKRGIIEDSIGSVSYTHLDVYKRQHQISMHSYWQITV